MKLPNKAIQEKAMKLATDGIIDVLMKMYVADSEERVSTNCEPLTFFEFCAMVRMDTPEAFYQRPVRKEDK